ncbi:unnamed protein product [Gordionus sp. m RMFG-2023]
MRIPYARTDAMKQELNGWPMDSIIESVSQVRWARLLALVIKGDSSVRVCADLKDPINPALKDSRYSILRANYLIAKYAKGRIFTKIECKQTFPQIPIQEDPRDYSRSLPTRVVFVSPSHSSV